MTHIESYLNYHSPATSQTASYLRSFMQPKMQMCTIICIHIEFYVFIFENKLLNLQKKYMKKSSFLRKNFFVVSHNLSPNRDFVF